MNEPGPPPFGSPPPGFGQPPVGFDAPPPAPRGPGLRSDSKWQGLTALIIGILSLGAWCIPLCGFPVSLAGVVFGILALKTEGRVMGIIGLVMGGLGLVLSVVNAVAGAYMAMNNENPFFTPPAVQAPADPPPAPR